ncbi:hypothetical protein BDV95DRAFT_586210 [Massariosphaeria phaeospora]|uniref:Uncharacterized protein n=1 Tax=Massariosphaeria phaeospora TaxID=100035 RepID=A0A7C8I1M4_9PLEO|nr:hypothetical protein BDV95DRAFT_586210 [Massariosphaeria phaeospora]
MPSSNTADNAGSTSRNNTNDASKPNPHSTTTSHIRLPTSISSPREYISVTTSTPQTRSADNNTTQTRPPRPPIQHIPTEPRYPYPPAQSDPTARAPTGPRNRGQTHGRGRGRPPSNWAGGHDARRGAANRVPSWRNAAPVQPDAEVRRSESSRGGSRGFVPYRDDPNAATAMLARQGGGEHRTAMATGSKGASETGAGVRANMTYAAAVRSRVSLAPKDNNAPINTTTANATPSKLQQPWRRPVATPSALSLPQIQPPQVPTPTSNSLPDVPSPEINAPNIDTMLADLRAAQESPQEIDATATATTRDPSPILQQVGKAGQAQRPMSPTLGNVRMLRRASRVAREREKAVDTETEGGGEARGEGEGKSESEGKEVKDVDDSVPEEKQNLEEKQVDDARRRSKRMGRTDWAAETATATATPSTDAIVPAHAPPHHHHHPSNPHPLSPAHPATIHAHPAQAQAQTPTADAELLGLIAELSVAGPEVESADVRSRHVSAEIDGLEWVEVELMDVDGDEEDDGFEVVEGEVGEEHNGTRRWYRGWRH